MTEAQNRPKREYTPKPKPIFDFGDVNHSNGGYTSSMAPPPSRNSGRKSDISPACRDFCTQKTNGAVAFCFAPSYRNINRFRFANWFRDGFVGLRSQRLTIETSQPLVEPKRMSVCLCAQQRMCASKTALHPDICGPFSPADLAPPPNPKPLPPPTPHPTHTHTPWHR